jgi:hypothetical protein
MKLSAVLICPNTPAFVKTTYLSWAKRRFGMGVECSNPIIHRLLMEGMIKRRRGIKCKVKILQDYFKHMI